MKPIRIKDFDPDASVPELKSPIDDYPRIEAPKRAGGVFPLPQPPLESPSLPSEPTSDERTPVRTPVVPYARTDIRRTITRYAFEFFQDQIESLRQFSLEEKGRGEKGSMSQMVREALDQYIARRRNSL